VLRVVGSVDAMRLGHTSWAIRTRSAPDVAGPVATAPAKRSNTFWVHVLSGGTEIACGTTARTAQERGALLPQPLPRTGRISSVTAHSQLHLFVGGRRHGLVGVDRTAADGPPGRRRDPVLRRRHRAGGAGLPRRGPAVDVRRPARLASVGRALARHVEISFAAATTGPTNLMAGVVCRDDPALYRYLTERIGALDGVKRLETAP
jgi:Lrp/AsnC ligand binding domain